MFEEAQHIDINISYLLSEIMNVFMSSWKIYIVTLWRVLLCFLKSFKTHILLYIVQSVDQHMLEFCQSLWSEG